MRRNKGGPHPSGTGCTFSGLARGGSSELLGLNSTPGSPLWPNTSRQPSFLPADSPGDNHSLKSNHAGQRLQPPLAPQASRASLASLESVGSLLLPAYTP